MAGRGLTTSRILVSGGRTSSEKTSFYSDLYTTSYLDHWDRISADVSGMNRHYKTYEGREREEGLFQQSFLATGKSPVKVFAINFKNTNGPE